MNDDDCCGQGCCEPELDDTQEIPAICGDCCLQEVCCRDDA